MEIPPHDEDRIARRALEILGGKEEFIEAIDNDLAEINTRWNQNVEVIGRILRAHLFVEHYLTQYLQDANPNLGSLSSARVSFAQKVSLLDSENSDVASLLIGIKQLNKIRNRLAHNLDAQVTDNDAKIFLKCERFAALRTARSSEEEQSNKPMEILEDFAKHTAVALTYELTPLSKAIAQAIEEINHENETT